VRANTSDFVQELEIFGAQSLATSDDQVERARCYEGQNGLIIWDTPDAPAISLEDIIEEFVDVRAGIDDEGVLLSSLGGVECFAARGHGWPQELHWRGYSLAQEA